MQVYTFPVNYPYVGLVVFYDSAGEFIWRCSGSLIDPRTFLTAGHSLGPRRILPCPTSRSASA